MKKLVAILSVCLVLLLGFCLYLEITEKEEPLPPETQPPVFTVTFEAQGVLLSEQKLTAAETPKIFAFEPNGGRLMGWMDSQGNAVDPFAVKISDNTTYCAVIRPLLSKHTPYLFVNSEGNICPDVPLTRIGFSMAMKALAAPGAIDYFPEFPDGSIAISGVELTELLGHFFDSEIIATAFPQAETITRSEFAKGMNLLLCRGGGEQFTIAHDYTLPDDITMDRTDAADLLEASIGHTPADAGSTWEEIHLPTTYEPGFINLDGWLYYVQEDGYFLRDDYVGTLYFGADGRYTSTDAELDEMVAKLLKEMFEQNPEADRFEILRVAFDYCHQNHTYRRIYDGNPAYGSTGWEIELAKDMFTSTKGNCYSFSSIFWALSRGLGYETRAISGKCLSDEQPHSWCIIELDGEDYIFDPQWQYDYTQRKKDIYDMFKIPMDQVYIWLYQWDE